MAYRKRPYPIADGGTNATSASAARTSLSVPAIAAVMLLDGTQAMGADMALGNFKITGLGTPSSSTDAATKAYVDSTAAGIDWKASVRVATTASITLSGTQTIDGIAVIAADRVLVKDQGDATNGLYLCAAGAWTRTTDADVSAEVTAGIAVFVEEGTVNADTGWVLTNDGTVTLGSTVLTFTQFTGIGAMIAGAGLTRSGNTVNVGAGTGITVNADDIQISASYPGQSTIVTLGTIVTGVWTGTAIAVANGGTGSGTASGARTNLAAAPAAPIYWVGASNAEIANAVVPAGSGGVNVTASTGAISIDTAVVATTSNSLTMANKTLTSPVINTPKIVQTIRKALDADTTLAATDSLITFLTTAQRTLTLPAGGSTYSGIRVTVKNRAASTNNVVFARTGADTIDNTTTFTVEPGNCVDVVWDQDEWVLI